MEELIKHTCRRKSNITVYMKIPAIIAASFVLSSAELFGSVSPFGAAFMSGLCGSECIWAFCGSCLGFFVSGGDFISGIPALVAVFAVGLLRIAICGRGRWSLYISSAFTAFAVLLCGIMTSESVSELILSAGLAGIAATGSFALLTLRAMPKKKGRKLFVGPRGIIALGIVFMFACAALSGVQLHIINAAAVTVCFVTLTVGEKYGAAKAAVAAILGCCGASLSVPENAVWCMLLPVSGMIGAIASRKGKITQASAAVLCTALLICVSGAGERELTLLADMLIAALLFGIAPTEELTDRLETEARRTISGTEPLHIFSDKLREIGLTMGEVRNAVIRTSDALEKESTADISWVYSSVCERVCRSCKSNMCCWGEEYNATADMMNKLVIGMKLGKQIAGEDFPEAFSERCTRRSTLAAALNCQYSAFVSANIAGRKISEMRKILISQLDATERLMLHAAEEFESGNAFLTEKSSALETLLRAHGMKNVTAAVIITDGKMTAEAYGDGKPELSREKLCELTSAALQREMDLPEIHTDMQKTKITMFERAKYCAETEFFQFNKGKNEYCGDYFDTFIDGRGSLYAIISDGMGSGSRARIDAAFACGMLVKLLRSGVDTETAIHLLNNALLVKSGDESFATLDICKIDLYSGRAELIKAGGSFSYVKCGREIATIDGSGTPVGINHSVQTRSSVFSVSEGDIVFMASDGAEINKKWLENVTEGEYSLAEMVEIIAASARNSSEKKHGDDITVAAVRVMK